MSEFSINADGELERRRHAAVGLVWRVNSLLELHPRTMNLDIRDVMKPAELQEDQRQNELIRMSANNHMKCLAAFYKRLNPEATSVKILDGVHSALPLYDTMTQTNIMLLATNLELPNNRSLGAISVTVRDEYVLSGNTIYMNDDGQFEGYSDVKPRDDRLVTEALELVGVGRRDLVVPVLSGVIQETELAGCLSKLRPIVAETYDAIETERFLNDLEQRYHQKVSSRSTAEELGLAGMSSGEIEDLIEILKDAESWS